MRDKVSGAIAIPRQAGDVPQLAEPHSGGIPRSEVSNYEPQAK